MCRKPDPDSLLGLQATFSPEEVEKSFDGKMPPEWLRISFYDKESPYRDIDRVYLPAHAFASQIQLFMQACVEDVPMTVQLGHLYVPASWLAQLFPCAKDAIETIVKRVVEAASKEEKSA